MVQIINPPSAKKTVRHLFPTYEVGSLPKLPARVKTIKGEKVSAEELQQIKNLAKKYAVESAEVEEIIGRTEREKRKVSSEEKKHQSDESLLSR